MDREQQSSPPGATRATPPTTESKSKAAAAKPQADRNRATEGGHGEPATTAPDIMSRLPKTRPQRVNQRRRGTAAKDASRATTASGATRSARQKPSPKRSAATTERRPAVARPRTRARPPAPGGGSAPGLPRLAVDGAAEALKLPLKVSGRLTLKALDAVARGLRRR